MLREEFSAPAAAVATAITYFRPAKEGAQYDNRCICPSFDPIALSISAVPDSIIQLAIRLSEALPRTKIVFGVELTKAELEELGERRNHFDACCAEALNVERLLEKMSRWIHEAAMQGA